MREKEIKVTPIRTIRICDNLPMMFIPFNATPPIPKTIKEIKPQGGYTRT
ncbi:hypothetical protein [Dethiosulfovibrio faecalis]|nr:hypothetical protein [Dethiosulfovibrio faecalis]